MGDLARRVSMILRRLAMPKPKGETMRLGTSYGGWHVRAEGVRSGAIVYSGGVGEDASFDLELIRRFGCEVWAFDPTPRAIAYAASINDERFHFFPVGLWSADGPQTFFPPADAEHVSHSIGNLQEVSGSAFTAECRSIQSLMRELGHDRIDLLKLDIEGAELTVLAAVTGGEIAPSVLAVEFHPKSVVDTTRVLQIVRRLRKRGYRLLAEENWDLTFVRP